MGRKLLSESRNSGSRPDTVTNIPWSSNGRTKSFGLFDRGSNPCDGTQALVVEWLTRSPVTGKTASSNLVESANMTITAPEIEFLRESNNIEEEWDDKSLEDAIIAWLWLKPKKKLTRALILEVHQILMDTRTTIKDEFKGRFRNDVVYIGGKPAKPHYAIENLLDQWIKNANQGADRYESIPEEKVHAAREAHIQYEAIHPFFDGNGRTGRIFYNWQRIKCGLPIHIIEAKTKHEKYYTWFT